jgi:hypothetical protein
VPDVDLRANLREKAVVDCSADTVSALRSAGALPGRDALVLG